MNPEHLDAMGYPFSSWLVARKDEHGRALRDADGRVVYETQDARAARLASPINDPASAPAQQELFA